MKSSEIVIELRLSGSTARSNACTRTHFQIFRFRFLSKLKARHIMRSHQPFTVHIEIMIGKTVVRDYGV